MSRLRFRGHMHPAHAVRFPYQPPPKHPRLRNAVTAIVLGLVAAAIFAFGPGGATS